MLLYGQLYRVVALCLEQFVFFLFVSTAWPATYKGKNYLWLSQWEGEKLFMKSVGNGWKIFHSLISFILCVPSPLPGHFFARDAQWTEEVIVFMTVLTKAQRTFLQMLNLWSINQPVEKCVFFLRNERRDDNLRIYAIRKCSLHRSNRRLRRQRHWKRGLLFLQSASNLIVDISFLRLQHLFTQSEIHAQGDFLIFKIWT